MISMRGVGGYVRPAEVGSPDQPGISPPAGEGGVCFATKTAGVVERGHHYAPAPQPFLEFHLGRP
jgi:hypothetical protein